MVVIINGPEHKVLEVEAQCPASGEKVKNKGPQEETLAPRIFELHYRRSALSEPL